VFDTVTVPYDDGDDVIELYLKVKHFHIDMFGLYINEYGSDLLVYDNSMLAKYPLKKVKLKNCLKL
jgi:hypothetical protein